MSRKTAGSVEIGASHLGVRKECHPGPPPARFIAAGEYANHSLAAFSPDPCTRATEVPASSLSWRNSESNWPYQLVSGVANFGVLPSKPDIRVVAMPRCVPT